MTKPKNKKKKMKTPITQNTIVQQNNTANLQPTNDNGD